MTKRLGVWVRVAMVAACLLAPACSAVISPDTARLVDDAGITSAMDSTIPEPDAWAPPGDDAWSPGHDAGMPRHDAWVPPPVDTRAPCGPGLVLCNGRCVSLATDPAHCGSCTIACAGGATCMSGMCSAGASPLGNPADCGPSHSTCLDLQVCFNGTCECRPPYTALNGRCIDLNTDPNHCGAPGVDCGSGVCYMGRCFSGCPFGTRDCSSACVEIRRDPGNCGGCGTLCSGRQVCVTGQCHDVSVPASCNMCPCPACGTAQCCRWGSFNVTACVSGITSCG